MNINLNILWVLVYCQWWNQPVDRTVKGLEKYEFSECTAALHSWWLYQLCDAFIELVKPAMFGEDEELKKNAQDSL